MKRTTAVAAGLVLVALTGCSQTQRNNLSGAANDIANNARQQGINVPSHLTTLPSGVNVPSLPGSGGSGVVQNGQMDITSVSGMGTPGSCHYGKTSNGFHAPDPSCTPGALNAAVTQATIRSTICVSGYTKSIRLATTYSDPEKVNSARAYGYTGNLHTAELDHLMPLELGGANDPRNLWTQPNDKVGATGTTNPKDGVESSAHAAVCAGRVTLKAAQEAILKDWTTALPSLGLNQVKSIG